MTENCVICLDEIKGDEYLTKCNHKFHKECLEKWTVNTCPVCRSILDESKPVDKLITEHDLALALEILYDELMNANPPVLFYNVNFYLDRY